MARTDQLQAAGKRPLHSYRECEEDDCPAYPCKVYKEGFRDGYATGYSHGASDGYVAGYEAGYAAGAAAASAGRP